MKKYLLSVSILIFSVFLFCSGSLLVDANEIEVTQSTPTINSEGLSEQVTTINSDKPLSEEKTKEVIEEQSDKVVEPRATAVDLSYFLVRNGSSILCEAYVRVKATSSIRSIKWSSLKIQSTSLLNPKVYKTFSNKLINFPAMMLGTAKIGALNVPAKEKRVSIIAAGTKAESLKDGWGSLFNFRGQVGIN